MSFDLYILDDEGNPRREPDMIKWGMWFEANDRHVASTQVGEVWISTVFLGMDHNWQTNGPPILWETMTFRGDRTKTKTVDIMGHTMTMRDQEQEECERCSGSREQAEAMHSDMVERVKAVELLKSSIRE